MVATSARVRRESRATSGDALLISRRKEVVGAKADFPVGVQIIAEPAQNRV